MTLCSQSSPPFASVALSRLVGSRLHHWKVVLQPTLAGYTEGEIHRVSTRVQLNAQRKASIVFLELDHISLQPPDREREPRVDPRTEPCYGLSCQTFAAVRKGRMCCGLRALHLLNAKVIEQRLA